MSSILNAINGRGFERVGQQAIDELSHLGSRLNPRRRNRRANTAKFLAGAIPLVVALIGAGVAVRRKRREDAEAGVQRSDLRAVSPAVLATPAEHVAADAEAALAPDPRRHYPSPEDLREDHRLDLPARRQLLAQWKDEVDRELEAEAEGMSYANQNADEIETGLAGEARRVSKALASIDRDLAAAA